MSAKVLVLGGTGFIGAAVAAAYLERGEEVHVLARRPPNPEHLAQLGGAELVVGDAAERESIERALVGVRHVVYAVGQLLPAESSVTPIDDLVASLPPLITVLDALCRAGGTTLTYLSSGGTVYGNPSRLPVAEDAPCDPITGYGITKLAAEKYVGMYSHLHDVPMQVLRIANAYGPRQPAGRSQGVIAALFAAHLTGGEAHLYGDSVRDYVFIDDVVAAVLALEPTVVGGPPINVGSGVGTSLSQVVAAIEQATGQQLRVAQHPARAFDVAEIVLDVTRVAGMIDWHPMLLDDGIATTWSYLCSVIAAGQPS